MDFIGIDSHTAIIQTLMNTGLIVPRAGLEPAQP